MHSSALIASNWLLASLILSHRRIQFKNLHQIGSGLLVCCLFWSLFEVVRKGIFLLPLSVYQICFSQLILLLDFCQRLLYRCGFNYLIHHLSAFTFDRRAILNEQAVYMWFTFLISPRMPQLYSKNLLLTIARWFSLQGPFLKYKVKET